MTDAKRIAVLASGRGTDLQSLLDAHADGRIASRVVVVASDKPAAKALERARGNGLAAIEVAPDAKRKGDTRRTEHETRMIEALDAHQPDLVVLAGYMRILTPAFVAHYQHRLINVHPALLPSFVGTRAQAQALDWGVRVAGCTTHFVDSEVDHGPIILQAAVPVQPDDDHDRLAERILKVEHQLLPRTVNLWEEGRLRLEGRRVRIDAGTSWTQRYPTIPGVLYGPGY